MIVIDNFLVNFLPEYKNSIDQVLSIIKNGNVSLDDNTDNFTGRGSVIKSRLESGSNIIIKTLRHGGLFSKILNTTFFSIPLSKNRVFSEFKILVYLRSKGVRVPKPICAVIEKTKLPFFYKGYLCLETLDCSRTLLDMINSDVSEEEILSYSLVAGELASVCLSLGVCHIDLHLGNVLVSHGSCYLIDFDKAKIDKISDNEINYLLDRWKRSLNKRVSDKKLSDKMFSVFEKGLNNFKTDD